MAASERFRIPTVEEMERPHADLYSKGSASLFKKSRETRTTPDEGNTFTCKESVTEKKSSIQAPAPTVSASSKATSSTKSSVKNNIDKTAEITRASTSADADTGIAQESTANKTGSSNSLIVNTRQRGNPILKSVRNIPWEYGNIVPDYVMGQSNCALFLSLRYHQLHPNYIHDRLKQLGKSYELRVMLVQVDVKDPHHLLKDLAKMCILADCTLILAFSTEEAGRYLETYKIFENKPPEAIMEKTEENFMAKFTDCLTSVKSVNKTDCSTLLTHFGSLSNVMEAAKEDLSLCPGFGPQKAKRLHDMFHEPFKRTTSSRQRHQPGPSLDAAR